MTLLQVEGAENLPADSEAAVYVSNHQSFLVSCHATELAGCSLAQCSTTFFCELSCHAACLPRSCTVQQVLATACQLRGHLAPPASAAGSTTVGHGLTGATKARPRSLSLGARVMQGNRPGHFLSCLQDIFSLFHLGRSFKFVSKTSIFFIPIVGWSMFLTGALCLLLGPQRTSFGPCLSVLSLDSTNICGKALCSEVLCISWHLRLSQTDKRSLLHV